MKFGKSSSHKGAASVRASIQKAGDKLKKQTADFYSNNTTPEAVFAGSKTAAALSQAFSEPVGVDEAVLASQLVQESGNCLNKLSYLNTANNLFTMMQVADGTTVDGFKYEGTLAFDERARVMASVGVAIVLCKIIHGAKSRMITGTDGLEKKLIYVEDILEYIHEKHGDVITMDKTSNAAFERLSRGADVTPHERKLLGELTTGVATNFYQKKYEAMIDVKAANVGGKWKAGAANASTAHTLILAATKALIAGNSRIMISSNLSIPNIQRDAEDIAALMLSLVAMHILTYAITACLDFYYKMARMASDDGKSHKFTTDETVTHSVFAPGLLAALRMYGVSDNEFDEHMAFQINTIDDVKKIFKYGREAYDEGDNNIGAKMFQNKGTDTPAWLIPAEQKMKYKAEYSKSKSVKGTTVNTTLPGAVTTMPTANDVADALAKKYSSGSLNPSVSRRLNSMVGVTGFGKKRRSSKKRASFGKKRRSHKKRASFGKKRRSHRRSKH